MVLFWLTLVLTVIGSNAEGELCILHSPDSLTFIHTDETVESLLKEIFSASLGLSVERNAEWKGMLVMDPFNTPEAVVEVYIDGVSSLRENAGSNSKIFPLIADEYEPDTFKGVTLRIRQRFDSGNKIVNIKLSDDDHVNIIRNVFGNVNFTFYKSHPALKLNYLKRSIEEDRYFISELGILEAIIERIQSGALVPDNIIDFYHFRFRTLHFLSDFYGPHSLQTKEALKLLGDALQELAKAFVKAYDDSVLVTVITTDVAHTRRSARSLAKSSGHSKKWPYEWLDPPLDWQRFSPKEAPRTRRQEGAVKKLSEDLEVGRAGNDDKSKTPESSSGGRGGEQEILDDRQRDIGKVAPSKPYDMAPIFNIFMGFGMLMFFSMLAIIYACMDMDPGRDTIIYRMTTMRTKKDL